MAGRGDGIGCRCQWVQFEDGGEFGGREAGAVGEVAD